MREKKANSPLAKWLPGGSMSSTNQNPEPILSDAQIAENEMIELYIQNSIILISLKSPICVCL